MLGPDCLAFEDAHDGMPCCADCTHIYYELSEEVEDD
jgi:hypothetical protein